LSGHIHTNQTIEHYKLTLTSRDNFSVRLQRSSLAIYARPEKNFVFKNFDKVYTNFTRNGQNTTLT